MSVTEPAAAEPGSRPRRGRPTVIGLVSVTLGIAVLVVVLAVQELLVSGTADLGRPPAADHSAVAQAGRGRAPSFSLPALDGAGPIDLAAYRGEVVVLNFWASWCAPCRREAPVLQAAWLAYRDRGVQFIGVDILDNRSAALAFVAEFGITYRSAFDPDGTLEDDYELLGVPTTVFVDRKGRMAYRFTGALDAGLLRNTLDGMLEVVA